MGMRLGGLQIGIQRGHEPRHPLLEIRVLGERDPVAIADLGGKLGVGDRLAQDGQDPLLHLPGVLDLVITVRRAHCARRDHEQEGVRLLDRALDRLGEHLAILDPPGIQPHLASPALGDGIREPVHKLRIPARVRDENVGHQWSRPRPKSCSPPAILR